MEALAGAAEELAATSTEIGSAMARAQLGVGDAIGRAREAGAMIAELARAAEEIGGILDAISSVARQTNLLALNATIEAARAGAAGRGFAVVASEVKALSVETAASAALVRARIASLRTSAGASVGRGGRGRQRHRGTRAPIRHRAGSGRRTEPVDRRAGATLGGGNLGVCATGERAGEGGQRSHGRGGRSGSHVREAQPARRKRWRAVLGQRFRRGSAPQHCGRSTPLRPGSRWNWTSRSRWPAARLSAARWMPAGAGSWFARPP